jgi:hypothetical protein
MKVFILNLPAGRQACFRILNYERKFLNQKILSKGLLRRNKFRMFID